MKNLDDGPKPSGITPEQLDRVVEILRENEQLKLQIRDLEARLTLTAKGRGDALYKLDEQERLNVSLQNALREIAAYAEKHSGWWARTTALNALEGFEEKRCAVVSAEGHKCSAPQGHDGPHILAFKRVVPVPYPTERDIKDHRELAKINATVCPATFGTPPSQWCNLTKGHEGKHHDGEGGAW